MLQTDVIDASFNPVDLAFCFKDIEQGNFCLDPELLLTNFMSVWINLKTLKGLPPEYQKIMMEAGKQLEIMAGEEINPNWQKKIYATWKKDPKFVYTKLSDEDRKIWADRCEDIPAEWAEEVTKLGYPGWEIVKRYQEITTELGHKWPRQWGVKK
jgi:TRAP-type C4-dicarboxylate transport system substrate-binding protein